MAEQLTRSLIDQTPEENFDQEAYLEALARLSPIAYDQHRDEAAKRLGVRTQTLDNEVKNRQQDQGQEDAQGKPVDFEDPEASFFPVHGPDLIEELCTVFTPYLILPQGGAETLALWTLHAYTYDAGSITPRLGITSPQKRCGKTRVLEVLSLLTPRALMSSNVTAAAIFRAKE